MHYTININTLLNHKVTSKLYLYIKKKNIVS